VLKSIYKQPGKSLLYESFVLRCILIAHIPMYVDGCFSIHENVVYHFLLCLLTFFSRFTLSPQFTLG